MGIINRTTFSAGEKALKELYSIIKPQGQKQVRGLLEFKPLKTEPAQTVKKVVTSGNNPSYCYEHFDGGGGYVFSPKAYPKDYMKHTREFVEAEPAQYEDIYEMSPHYHIDKLWGQGKATEQDLFKML